MIQPDHMLIRCSSRGVYGQIQKISNRSRTACDFRGPWWILDEAQTVTTFALLFRYYGLNLSRTLLSIDLPANMRSEKGFFVREKLFCVVCHVGHTPWQCVTRSLPMFWLLHVGRNNVCRDLEAWFEVIVVQDDHWIISRSKKAGCLMSSKMLSTLPQAFQFLELVLSLSCPNKSSDPILDPNYIRLSIQIFQIHHEYEEASKFNFVLSVTKPTLDVVFSSSKDFHHKSELAKSFWH